MEVKLPRGSRGAVRTTLQIDVRGPLVFPAVIPNCTPSSRPSSTPWPRGRSSEPTRHGRGREEEGTAGAGARRGRTVGAAQIAAPRAVLAHTGAGRAELEPERKRVSRQRVQGGRGRGGRPRCAAPPPRPRAGRRRRRTFADPAAAGMAPRERRGAAPRHHWTPSPATLPRRRGATSTRWAKARQQLPSADRIVGAMTGLLGASRTRPRHGTPRRWRGLHLAMAAALRAPPPRLASLAALLQGRGLGQPRPASPCARCRTPPRPRVPSATLLQGSRLAPPRRGGSSGRPAMEAAGLEEPRRPPAHYLRPTTAALLRPRPPSRLGMATGRNPSGITNLNPHPAG
ncbi:hypothetical protein PVAP13_9KG537352 [Panicum virgatum]|uniref:Uncharacterized protein n=1 Tax=Panicum virgatum TaxID=38727 RepID=A0A8T0NYZ6_PANVG|nr:hypothetical protein PVAP13_9KG537352 [Panicum virgatum]